MEGRLDDERTKQSGKLDELSNRTNRSDITKILMSYNSFGDTLRLLFWCTILLQQVESEVTTVELKGQEGCMEVLLRGANIVEEAC